MRMKKLLTSVCVIAMVAVLGACGGGKTSAEDVTGKDAVVTGQPDTKEPEKPEEGKDSEKEEVSEDKPVEKEEKEEPFNILPSIEETVLWNESGLMITATELTYTAYNAEVALLIENNGDADASVVAGSIGYCCNAVNGYMMPDGYVNVDVSAGKKAKETVTFSLAELAVYGIKEIADIQIGFQIGIGDADDFYTGPRTVKTSIADSYDYAENTYRKNVSSGKLGRDLDGKVNFFKEKDFSVMEGVAVESYALVTNSEQEKMLLLEVKNGTDELIRCDIVGLSVNDLYVYRYSMESGFIAPGCYAVMGVDLDYYIEEAYRSAFGLSSYDKLGFTVKVRDEGYTELLAEQEICVELNDKVTQIDTSGTEVFNQDGIRVVSKGLFEDSSKYSEDIHWVLLVENNYSEAVQLTDVYDSLSVNGFMTDYMLYSETMEQGERIVLDIKIDADSLADNDVAEIADISELEVSIEFKTLKYDEIAEATLKVEF